MTNDQARKPSLELDILVAQKVMKLNVVCSTIGIKRPRQLFTIEDPYYFDIAGDLQLQNPIPPYSTEIASAWDVVEKLPYVFELTTNSPYGATTPETEWLASFDAEFEAHGESAPHAICLAALRAIEHDIK